MDQIHRRRNNRLTSSVYKSLSQLNVRLKSFLKTQLLAMSSAEVVVDRYLDLIIVSLEKLFDKSLTVDCDDSKAKLWRNLLPASS